MCELLGISAKRAVHCNELLEEFFSHSRRHPHAWGLARLDSRNVSINVEPIAAYKSALLKRILSEKLCTKRAIAHIRYATIGDVGVENCHPFVRRDNSGRSWTLAHNGTIFEHDGIDKLARIQAGETDSERLLLYIVNRLNDYIRDNGKKSMVDEVRFSLVSQLVEEISYKNKLNLLICDGEYMYVHCNFRNTLYCMEDQNSVVFSTKALNVGSWSPVPFMRTLVYKNGKLVYEGKPHKNEYIPTVEQTKNLYAVYSQL